MNQKFNVENNCIKKESRSIYLEQCYNYREEAHECSCKDQWSWKDNWPLVHKSLDIITWIRNRKYQNSNIDLVYGKLCHAS